MGQCPPPRPQPHAAVDRTEGPYPLCRTPAIQETRTCGPIAETSARKGIQGSNGGGPWPLGGIFYGLAIDRLSSKLPAWLGCLQECVAWQGRLRNPRVLARGLCATQIPPEIPTLRPLPMDGPNFSGNREVGIEFLPTTPHRPGVCPTTVLSPGQPLLSPGLRHRLFLMAPTFLSPHQGSGALGLPANVSRDICPRNTQTDLQTLAHPSQARLGVISPQTCLPSREGLTAYPWPCRNLKVILDILPFSSPCSSHPVPKFSFQFISPLCSSVPSHWADGHQSLLGLMNFLPCFYSGY